jgi:glycosyltransferase involved in cell wall biosynthesis
MKHIVIDARELRTSTGRYVERLIHYLQGVDYANHYTILLKPQDMDGWHADSPNFKKVACPHKEFTFDEQLGFLAQLDEIKADLVHFPMVQQPVLYQGRVVTTMQDLTTIRFKNPAKNPLVFTAKQQVYKWLNKRVAHKSAALIAPTEFVKQDVAAYCHVPLDKITVTLESSDDLPSPAQPVDSLQDKRFIMYLGRPTPHKNLERLIQAFGKLQENHPDLYLALAGKKDANYARIEMLSKEQGIERIIFTDFVSDQQLRWMYEHCSVYVFPSLSEGFGLPGLEAMRHGAPVASSNATCLPEVYGEAAHYFDPLSVDDMAAKINDLLTDEDLRQKLIIAGQTHVASFSWQRMAEQTLDVYQQVLAE